MRDILLEILKIFDDHGYSAYAVGGYVRDYLLNIESNDIDITTNAKPKEIKDLFKSEKVEIGDYGETTLYYKKVRFEITTFRVENNYGDNRHPKEIQYVNDLKTDLLRRDFKINTICIDKDGNIVDLLNGEKDLKDKIISPVRDADTEFKEDALRILRAIRFSVNLKLELNDEIKESIINNKDLLKNISYNRKKEELDKIFAKFGEEGIKKIKELDLVDVLELENIDRVKYYQDIMSIWSMLNTKNYPFTKEEKNIIEKINKAYDMDNLDKFNLYYNGLYVNTIAGLNKGIDKVEIAKVYDELPIKDRNDINIEPEDIIKLGIKPGSIISEIFKELEKDIINKIIFNTKEDIEKYIKEHYL